MLFSRKEVLISGHCLMLFIGSPVWAASVNTLIALEPISDQALSEVVAQGLIVTDKIDGNGLPGASQFSSPFTFYRIGLDGELDLNMNIAKLQLGCGGVNDFIARSPACDVDLDFVSFLGKNELGNAPGEPLSDFKLVRPMIEFAIKNDGSRTQREVVGIKIGAQQADGALSVGRVLTQAGAINQENTAAGTVCDPSASTGSGVLGCHSGINSVSGFLGAEMSITMRVQARICGGILIGSTCLGLPVPVDAFGCIGRTRFGGDDCGEAKADALFVDVAGTRMNSLGLASAQLALNGDLIGDLLGNAFAQLSADLRLVHFLVFDETPDFFLSFQREPVAWPRFDKATPSSSLGATDLDACAGTSFARARCNSAFSVPANTGWWLNAPSVKLLA